MPGALMRRWSLEVYADHTGGTRGEESLRPFSGFAARRLAPTASAVQGRCCAAAAGDRLARSSSHERRVPSDDHGGTAYEMSRC